MRHKGRISVEEGSSKHPSARPVKRTVVPLTAGFTATTKVTKTRYKKINGKFVPVAVDGISFKREHDEQVGIEEFSAADYLEEYNEQFREEYGEDMPMDGESKHIFQLINDGMIDDDSEDSSPFIG